MPSADVFVFHHCCSGQWQREKTNGNTDILHADFQLYSQSSNSTMKVSYLSPNLGYLLISNLHTWNLGNRQKKSKHGSTVLLTGRNKKTLTVYEQYKPVTVGVSSQQTHHHIHRRCSCWDEHEQNGGVGYISHQCDLTREAHIRGMASVQKGDFYCIISAVSVNFYTVQ